MYCPRPGRKSKVVNATTPGKKRVYAPPPRTEACNESNSSVVTDPTGGGSTTNTIFVPGPAGAPGPAGTNGTDGWGFIWRGEFALGVNYKKQSSSNPLADVVSWVGNSYVCIEDNTSTDEDNPEFGPDTTPTHWSLLAQKGDGSGSLPPEDQDFFDSLKDDIFDWVQNASIGDLIAAGLAVAGIIWAGSEIVDMITDTGEGDGEADQRYTGSDGYVTTAYTAPDIKDVITSLCTAAGITFDVTSLPNAPCEFSIGNQTSIRGILGTLALSYQFDMVDSGGVLRFVTRSTSPVKTLTLDDVGFAESPERMIPYTVKRFQGTDLPKSVTLKYPAQDLDYNTFTQRADIVTYTSGQEITLETPVTLSHDRAKEVVELTLINAHLQRQQYRFATSYKHIDLEPADVIDSPVGLVRLSKVMEKSEGIVELEAVDAGGELAVAGSGQAAVSPPASTNVPAVIGYSQTLFIDPPVLNDEDTGVRLYAATHGYDAPGWPGANIFVSTNGGASYESIGFANREATVGLVTAVTPTADWRVWDETTVIQVTLKTNEISSRTAAEVLNGANRCMVGQEVLAFRTATLVSPKTYTISGLLRGRLGTEQYVSTHQANELFVMLDDSLVRLDFDNSERFKTYRYKTVTAGSSIDKVTGIDVRVNSNNTLRWTPHATKLTKVGNDWTLSYKDRARYNNELKDFVTTANDPDFGGFGIQVWDVAGTTVAKNYTTTSQSWTYTAAMQTADFGALRSTLKVTVAPLSRIYGAGYSVTINS